MYRQTLSNHANTWKGHFSSFPLFGLGDLDKKLLRGDLEFFEYMWPYVPLGYKTFYIWSNGISANAQL